jgi:RNA polymerase sigma-70 factor (ECF subfamily)
MVEWDIVIEKHGPMVWRTAYRLLGNADDAEDCLQETFLAAVTFSERQRVRSWPSVLRYLAVARATDMLRQRLSREKRNCNAPDAALHTNQNEDPAADMAVAELSDRLREALAQLPPRQSQVFVLRFLEQMSYREIAAALELKTSAVGVALHVARRRLRDLLGEGTS